MLQIICELFCEIIKIEPEEKCVAGDIQDSGLTLNSKKCGGGAIQLETARPRFF